MERVVYEAIRETSPEAASAQARTLRGSAWAGSKAGTWSLNLARKTQTALYMPHCALLEITEARLYHTFCR